MKYLFKIVVIAKCLKEFNSVTEGSLLESSTKCIVDLFQDKGRKFECLTEEQRRNYISLLSAKNLLPDMVIDSYLDETSNPIIVTDKELVTIFEDYILFCIGCDNSTFPVLQVFLSNYFKQKKFEYYMGIFISLQGMTDYAIHETGTEKNCEYVDIRGVNDFLEIVLDGYNDDLLSGHLSDIYKIVENKISV